MGVPTSLPKLLRQFPWGFAGVVLGIGGMYIGLFYQRKPDLRVEILTNAAVVDVREDVSNLTIFYDSVDILRQHQSLRVVTTRFVNDGSADITGGMYDARDPVGVSFPGARIVQVPELLDASSEYLRDNVRVGLLDSSTFVFEPVILEAGESFVLKVLLLTADTASLSISPRGKVAGDRTIQLAESFGASADRRPVLERVFGGGLLIQLVRLVAYFVATALLVAAVAGAGAWSSSIPTKAKRRRLVRAYSGGDQLSIPDGLVIGWFRKGGIAQILGTHALLSKPAELQHALKDKSNMAEVTVLLETEEGTAQTERGVFAPHELAHVVVPLDDGVYRTEEIMSALRRFIGFLEDRKQLPKKRRVTVFVHSPYRDRERFPHYPGISDLHELPREVVISDREESEEGEEHPDVERE